MNLLVLGATGATGRLVVEQALTSGHHVNALVRSAQKPMLSHPNLSVITGEATETSDVSRAMKGTIAVISTLGAPRGTVMTDATRAMLAAAAEHGVNRIVMLSSFAVERDRLTGLTRAITGMAMRAALKDKAIAEEMLRASACDWTIIHATRLSDAAASGGASVVPPGVRLSMAQKISRADVAAWLLKEASADTGHLRQEFALTG
jgi:uncharacterized protein YbjT (DUF2867 family)